MKNPKNRLITYISMVFFISFQTINSQSITCNTIPCIQNAMANAQPGDEIIIEKGTYTFTNEDKIPGAFGRNAYLHSSKNGKSTDRIILRGKSPSERPVIQGVNYDDGYLLGLEGNYWTIQDIEFKTGSKGVILDNADYTMLIGLEIHDVGEEALHFRHGTTNSVADNCFIHDTGRNSDKTDFGEGVYIGSDRSVHNLAYNDTETYCPDWKRKQGRCGRFYNPSVNNITVKNSRIGPNVTAEHFDVREGTCQIFIEGNTLDAKGMILKDFQDSFIDLKGSYCHVRNNTFNQNSEPSIKKAIQVLDRDEGNGLIQATARNNAIHDNIFNMDDTDTPLFTFFRKGSDDDFLNYTYDNTRNPEGLIYKSGSDFVENTEPTFSIITCPDEGNQDSTLSTGDFTKNDISFSIVPNPAKEILTISSQKSIENVSIYTLQGQKMDVTFSKNSNSLTVSHLASGMYIAWIKTSNGVGTQLFTKQ